MNRKLVVLFMSFVFTIALCGPLMAGGRGPDPDPRCTNLPKPNKGLFLWGSFTAALDKSQCSIDFPQECAHFNVNAALWNFRAVHLYSFSAPIGEEGLCILDEATLKQVFAEVPCSLAVGEDFGLSGVPVIKNLTITKRDFCDDPQKQMIQGVMLLRVVP